MNKNRHTALLMIHGILGKPDFFDFLMPEVPADWTVRKISLSGHGGTPRDFSRTSMAEWREQVSHAVAELCVVHDRVVIVAHSMGCLFAIRESIKQPIDALFLLNPPLNIHVTGRLVILPWKMLRGKIDMNNKWMAAAKRAYSIEHDGNILHYAGWVPRYLELFGEIKRTRALARQLTTPAHIFYSRHDEMVSSRSKRIFNDKNFVEITNLADSGHYYYSDADKALISKSFGRIVSDFSPSKANAVGEPARPVYACHPAYV